jgi:hypothetical protein
LDLKKLSLRKGPLHVWNHTGFIERFSIRGKFQKGNPKETQVQRVRRH